MFNITCTNEITNSKGLFIFAQKTLPLLVDAVDSSPNPPSLLVTGATASVRGSAFFGTFAAGKFAQRALTQSLAREYGPKGVHVALAVIDGGIDTPWGKDRVVNNGVEDGKISPDAVSCFVNILLHLYCTTNTHGLDCRKLLALTLAAQICLHSGTGYSPICREILISYSVCDIINNTSKTERARPLDSSFYRLRVSSVAINPQ